MTRHFFYTRFMDGPPLITQFITIGLPKLPNSDKFVQTSLAPARVVSCFQTDVIRRNQPRVCHRKAIMKPLPRARVFSAIRRAQNKHWSRVGKCLACEFVFFCVIINTCCHSRSFSFFLCETFLPSSSSSLITTWSLRRGRQFRLRAEFNYDWCDGPI